jgi:DNA replication protein DnaC
MGIDDTLHKLNQMKLIGMVRLLEDTRQQDLSRTTIDEFVAMLVDAESDHRDGRRIQRLYKMSGLRTRASMEKLDFASSRGLDRNHLKRLADCSFITRGESICITGPTGAGKSYLAQILGNEAIARGYTILYSGFTRLMNQLQMSRADHSYEKRMRSIQRADLLILDDFGLEVLDRHSRLAFYEILEERYEKKSTILASQVPSNSWHAIIGEPTIADAICDRLLNGSHMIQLKGDSYRKKKSLPE